MIAIDRQGLERHALSLAILVRFVVFAPITVVGLLLMLFHYGGLGKLRQRKVEECG